MSLLDKLKDGDRRSIGRVNEVVENILEEPALFGTVFQGMLSHDPVLRMRCADAIEKVSAQQPGWLQPCKKKLLDDVSQIDQQEIQWHVAQMLPRLDLSPREVKKAIQILQGYLQSKSAIVKTFSLQALADFALRDEKLKPPVLELLEAAIQEGSAAMKSRCKKLLRLLRDPE